MKESDLDELERTCPITKSAHFFDPESGWCSRCGQVRDDGKIITLDAVTLREPRSVSA